MRDEFKQLLGYNEDSLPTTVCEKPSHCAMLQDSALLDPEIADKSFAALVDALYEPLRERCHLGSKCEYEREGFLEIQKRRYKRLDVLSRGDWKVDGSK
jgi:hypothetical protein